MEQLQHFWLKLFGIIILIVVFIAVISLGYFFKFDFNFGGKSAQVEASPSTATAVLVSEGRPYVVSIYALSGDISTTTEAEDPQMLLTWRYRAVLSDGSTIVADSTGVISSDAKGATSTVVRSVLPVKNKVPIGVSRTGEIVAWVSPSDKTLQIFRKVENKYIPAAIEQVQMPTSLAVTHDGAYILLSMLTEDGGTSVSRYSIETKTIEQLLVTDSTVFFINK